jgi:mycothiol synthase
MAGPEIEVTGPDDRAAIEALDAALRDATGHAALGDAVWRDLTTPGADSRGLFARAGGEVLAYLHVARSDTFAPQHWVLGLAAREVASDSTARLLDAAAAHIATHGGGETVVWLFDPTPADDRALEDCGFVAQRDLYQMRVALPLAETAAHFPDSVTVRTFEPERDEDAWLAVNNAAFGNHPDQGGWVRGTLARRMAEPWFDPSLFLLAEDAACLAGFDWLKVHEPDGRDPRIGEIFVIGVDPGHQGLGLGRALAVEGLGRVAARGITTGMLFVAAENAPALALYRALGFTVHRTDRAYVRTIAAR